VINDLVNRELIRRDFKFGQPVFKEDSEETKAPQVEEEEEEVKNEVATDMSEELNLAKYLRNAAEIEPSKPITEEEAVVPQPDADEWLKEYRKVGPKLKEICKVVETEHYYTHISKLVRLFKRIRDIMMQAGNSQLQNYVFLAEKALDEISSHEKRINSQVKGELVSQKI